MITGEKGGCCVIPCSLLLLELCQSAPRKAATRGYLALKLAAVGEGEARPSSPVCSIRNSLCSCGASMGQQPSRQFFCWLET